MDASGSLARGISSEVSPDLTDPLIDKSAAQSGRISRDFIEAVVIAMLAFAIGLATAAAICVGRIR
jgi:hypothetical protein